MTAPETASARLGTAFLLGLVLGLWYGFLRPLRRRHMALADGAFLGGAVWAWLYLGFAVCGGDLRLGYAAGLAAGGFVWELSLGQLLRRPFACFWRIIGKITGKIRHSLKKFLKNTKILFASAEKWVTIKWNNRRHSRRASGGRDYGRKEKSLQRHSSGLPPQQTSDQGSGVCCYRVVYGGTDHTALGSE